MELYDGVSLVVFGDEVVVAGGRYRPCCAATSLILVPMHGRFQLLKIFNFLISNIVGF